MQRLLIVITVIIITLLKFSSGVEAKVLPRFNQVRKATGYSSGVSVSARLRSDRMALIVNFNNLQKARQVFYTLSYQSDGVDQGVAGTIDASMGNNLTRELLFGTCSSGVCRYHQNLADMKLEVTSELASGKKTLKRFRVRI